nr:hypothetical protein [Streptacidiphilus rugosus]
MVDRLGLLPAVMVTAAGMPDRDAARPLLQQLRAASTASPWSGRPARAR